MSSNLERRYRRVLRVLPGWYRQQWEQDMVAAFLDSWLTGEAEADEYITRAAGPGWSEVASVVGLAARLYLTSAATARRFAWGQAIRCAALAVALVQAARGLDILVRLVWGRHLFGWLPAPPANIVPGTPNGAVPAMVWYLVAYAWIVAFVLLILRHYRIAQAIAALAIVPDLVVVLQGQFTDRFAAFPIGPWAFWILINLTPVLAMSAFRRTAWPAPGRRWLLALPVGYVLIYVPLLVLQATGNFAWIPDFSGLYCLLVSLACLAHAHRAWSRRTSGSGIWSLTLILLAADAGAYRIASIPDYLHDPHLVAVCLAELVILAAAVALVAADAVRTLAGPPALPPVSAPGRTADGLVQEQTGHVVPAPAPAAGPR